MLDSHVPSDRGAGGSGAVPRSALVIDGQVPRNLFGRDGLGPRREQARDRLAAPSGPIPRRECLPDSGIG